MSEKWIWLPDWASDLALWEDDLTDVDSSARHTFVPYEKMVPNLGDLYKLPGLSAASTVVGWGMGALALLKNASGRKPGQKWILLSPFADFCDDCDKGECNDCPLDRLTDFCIGYDDLLEWMRGDAE